jgi:hypothetical protein
VLDSCIPEHFAGVLGHTGPIRTQRFYVLRRPANSTSSSPRLLW